MDVCRVRVVRVIKAGLLGRFVCTVHTPRTLTAALSCSSKSSPSTQYYITKQVEACSCEQGSNTLGLKVALNVLHEESSR